MLERPVSDRPDAVAVVGRSATLTYRQLDEFAARSARALYALGVRPGHRVAFSLPNDTTIVAGFLGAMRLGAIWVGVNRQLAPPEKAYIADDAEVSVFVGDSEMIGQLCNGPRGSLLTRTPRFVVAGGADSEWCSLLGDVTNEALASPDPLAPAGIAYTSGTTGRPKGAVHSQHNLMLPAAVLVEERGYTESLRKADCFPLTILNLQVLSTLLVARAGGTAVLMDRVDPLGIAEWIERERATTFNGAPAMLYGLATDDRVHPEALRSLNDVWSGGSHCPEKTLRLFSTKFGLPVHTTYGLTEAPTMVSILPRGDDAHRDTSGRRLPHLDVRVAGPGGQPLPHDQVGEITIAAAPSGPWAGVFRPMLGYWRREQASDEALRDGTLHTGDLGRLDDEGYLIVEERQSSVILRGGANVYPAEVERVIDTHPGVAASCAVGLADERLGERVVAVVEPAGDDLDLEALRRRCEYNLARYKVPEAFVVARLPRNSMGKIVRGEVATSLAGELARAGVGSGSVSAKRGSSAKSGPSDRARPSKKEER